MQRVQQEIMKKKQYLEHRMLGHRVICPNKPTYYIVDCRISNCLHTFDQYLSAEIDTNNRYADCLHTSHSDRSVIAEIKKSDFIIRHYISGTFVSQCIFES